MTLNRNAVFADVDDLVQIEHCAFGFRGEGGIRRRLDLVSHTPATIGQSRLERRGYSSHGGKGPCSGCSILARVRGKASNEEN